MARQSADNIRTTITNTIIEALEGGGLPPWKRGWANDPNGFGLATSLSTGEAYRGINQLLLQVLAAKRGYQSRWFGWFGASERERPEDWFIYYGHHRESGLLDQSNSAQISKALKPFIDADTDAPDVIEEDHSHWAVGWIKGWSVRVYRDGQITEAFKVLHGFLERMAIYPILCEHHYSEMELEATWENIPLAAARIKDDYGDLPDDWADQVYQWLSDNRCNALENVDDHGGWPDESDQVYELIEQNCTCDNGGYGYWIDREGYHKVWLK